MPRFGPTRAAVLSAAVALVVCGIGLGARDLAGDELAMLTGSPVEILVKALHPDSLFTGHLPFSYWLRWMSLAALDATSAVTWRLHALVGVAVAASVTATVLPRGGLLAGLLVALSPVVAFHGQDSSNYAWTVAAGALVVAGLADPTRRAAWLTVGLCIGVLNDLYAVWLVVGAAAGCVVMAHAAGRILARAWIGPALVGLPVAALVVAQVVGVDGAVGLHADPAPADVTGWTIAVERLQRFSGSALGGYASGRGVALWERVPALAVLVGAAAAALRRPNARTAGVVLVGGLAGAVLTGQLLLATTGRVLPVEPRTMIVFVPALSVALAAGVANLTGPARALATSVVLALVGGATLQQSLDRSTMHRDAARKVSAALADGEVVVAEDRLRWRLLAEGVPADRLVPCLDAPPDAPGVWWLRVQPLDHPLSWAACVAGDGVASKVALDGWRVAATWTAGPPAHERNAASFLMPVVAVRHVRDPSAAPASDVLDLNISVTPALWDGTAGGSLVALDPTGRSSWLPVTAQPIRLRVPVTDLSLVELRVRPDPQPWAPKASMFDPLRRDVQQWEAIVVAPTLQDTSFTVPARPMRSPAWQVLRRLLMAALAGLLAAGAVGRSRP